MPARRSLDDRDHHRPSCLDGGGRLLLAQSLAAAFLDQHRVAHHIRLDDGGRSRHFGDLTFDADHLRRRVARKPQPVATDLDEQVIVEKPVDLLLDTFRAKARADQGLADRAHQIPTVEHATGFRQSVGQFRQAFGEQDFGSRRRRRGLDCVRKRRFDFETDT